jgi:hypothetical protein
VTTTSRGLKQAPFWHGTLKTGKPSTMRRKKNCAALSLQPHVVFGVLVGAVGAGATATFGMISGRPVA